jgi:hypothetical protein
MRQQVEHWRVQQLSATIQRQLKLHVSVGLSETLEATGSTPVALAISIVRFEPSRGS